MSRRTSVIVASAVAIVVFAGVTAAGAWYFGLIGTNPTVQPGTPVVVPTAAVHIVASNLDVPWSVAHLPDGTALVTERDNARIVSIDRAGTVAEVTRITDARPGGEGGLLGIAVSPEYDQDGFIYAYYTAENDNRIVRFRRGDTRSVIFSGIPKAGNHNGGRIRFGPDGLLYVGTGDAGDRNGAQNRAFLGGKILRLNPDGTPASGNPFGNSPVYSYGHRNVQGLAWDDEGQLFAAEFGQNRYDEINRIEPGSNYGWPTVEGLSNEDGFVDPIATWATSDASPSGIEILGDTVYVACLRGTKLYRIGTGGKNAQALLDEEYGRLRDVSKAPDGSLWILTSNRDGRGSPADTDDRVIRLDPAGL